MGVNIEMQRHALKVQSPRKNSRTVGQTVLPSITEDIALTPGAVRGAT